MKRKDFNLNEDSISLYWPYYNIEIKSTKEYDDGFDVAVYAHGIPDKVIFYVKSASLEDVNLFTLSRCNYASNELTEELSTGEIIDFLLRVAICWY